MDDKVFDEQVGAVVQVQLGEQQYHGVVKCALGWACWKTYWVGRRRYVAQFSAMRLLGNGLSNAGHDEEALSVREALLATLRRFGGTAAHARCRAGQSCEHVSKDWTY